MSNYFICTAGTSVAIGMRDALFAKQKEPGRWDDRDPAFEKELRRLVDAHLRDKGTFARRSAETAVLEKAGVSAGDRVVLLATDSYLGRACSEETARLVANGFGLPDGAVETVRVEGLQVADAERLRKTGIPNFVRDVIRRIEENRYQRETKLCPVGGYKGVVPFLTALGMVYHLPVLYTFEYIDSLVRLPPLPFSLDRDLYLRAKRALVELGRRTEMPENEFLARIEGFEEEERNRFLAFVEPGDRPGFVTSSCFTETFAPDFERGTAPLSPQALEDLENLSRGQYYHVACKMAVGAQDQVVRSKWTHSKTPSTNLEILSQGNTAVRLLGYRAGDGFRVCRILLHGAYDRKLDGKLLRREDFPEDAFVEWSPPPESLPDSVKDAESPYDAAMRQLAEAGQKLDETVSEWAARTNEIQGARTAAEKGLRATQANLDEAKRALDEGAREIARLRDLVEESRNRVGELEARSDRERRAAQAAADRLEKENASLAAALRGTTAKLASIRNRGFLARLAAAFLGE